MLAWYWILDQPRKFSMDINADGLIFFDLNLFRKFQPAWGAVLFINDLNLKWNIFHSACQNMTESFLCELRHWDLNDESWDLAFKTLLHFNLFELVARNDLWQCVLVWWILSPGSTSAAVSWWRSRNFVLPSSLGKLRLIIFLIVLIAHHL